MTDRRTATASVATATPERYAKQLASHLSKRCEIREDPAGTRIVLADGDCLVQANQQTLDLHVEASTNAALDHITHVVGTHLERFGQRNELRVIWQRD
jgi:uncharacterized protein